MFKTLFYAMIGMVLMPAPMVMAGQGVPSSPTIGIFDRSIAFIAPAPPPLAPVKRHNTKFPSLSRPERLPFRFGLGLSARYAGPYDTDNSSINAGAGVTIDLISAISRGAALRFTLGLSGLHAAACDPGWYTPPPIPPPHGPLPVVGYDRDLTAMRSFLSLQYTTPIGRRPERQASFSLFSGFGAVTHFAREEIIVEEVGGELSAYRNERTTTIFAITLGCAGMFRLAPYLWLWVIADTDLHLTGEPTCHDCYEPLRPLYDYDGSYGLSLGLIMGR